MAEIGEFHVQVKFGKGIPQAYRGPLLLAFERMVRNQTALPAEVFMETMRDQNKLRRKLTDKDVI